MKTIIRATIATLALVSSPWVSAQQTANPAPDNAPLTRAQVTDQLRQLESAGFNPAQNDYYYPDQIESAQRRLDARDGTGPANPDVAPAANISLNKGY